MAVNCSHHANRSDEATGAGYGEYVAADTCVYLEADMRPTGPQSHCKVMNGNSTFVAPTSSLPSTCGGALSPAVGIPSDVALEQPSAAVYYLILSLQEQCRLPTINSGVPLTISWQLHRLQQLTLRQQSIPTLISTTSHHHNNYRNNSLAFLQLPLIVGRRLSLSLSLLPLTHLVYLLASSKPTSPSKTPRPRSFRPGLGRRSSDGSLPVAAMLLLTSTESRM